MKRKTCGFDFYILSKKLRDEILNGRIEKIYHIKIEDKYIIKFVIHKQSKKILLITNNSAFVYDNDIIENPQTPTNFAMVLRKYLENKFISDVSQCNNDKILSIKTLSNIIYFEFFGSGNVILCNEKNKIIDALVKRKWKGRAIKTGEIYKFPENMPNEEDKRLKFFFGVYYDTLPKDQSNLSDGIKILESKNKEGEILEIFKDLIKDALSEKDEKIEKELKKLEFVAEQQRKRIEELENEALLYTKIGDEIYKNFTVIEEILRNAKNNIHDSRIKRIEGNSIVIEI